MSPPDLRAYLIIFPAAARRRRRSWSRRSRAGCTGRRGPWRGPRPTRTSSVTARSRTRQLPIQVHTDVTSQRVPGVVGVITHLPYHSSYHHIRHLSTAALDTGTDIIYIAADIQSPSGYSWCRWLCRSHITSGKWMAYEFGLALLPEGRSEVLERRSHKTPILLQHAIIGGQLCSRFNFLSFLDLFI